MISQEDEELIKEMSNSEFPLSAFAHDIIRLRYLHPELEKQFKFDEMEEDLVKMARTFNDIYQYYGYMASYLRKHNLWEDFGKESGWYAPQ